MEKKRNLMTLAATIMSGIQVVFGILFAILMYSMKNNPDIEQSVNDNLAAQGYTWSDVGMSYAELMNYIVIFLLIVAIYYIIKFIIGLFAYLKTSAVLNLVAGAITAGAIVAIVILTRLVFLVLFDAIICLLFFLAYFRIKKDAKEENNYDDDDSNNNNQNDTYDKTVIDIEV